MAKSEITSADGAHAAKLTALCNFEGEILALQIIVQRLLGYVARTGAPHSISDIMRADHAQASVELAQTNITGEPTVTEAIRAAAQLMLDDIYTVASGSR